MEIQIGIGVVIIIWLVLFVLALKVYFSSQKKLSWEKIKFFLKRLEKISKENSYKSQILDFDVLYHKILLELWYKWNFWEILKQSPLVIDDLDEVWKLHKLRNKLAHDFDILEESVLKRKSQDFQKAIQKLLKKVS